VSYDFTGPGPERPVWSDIFLGVTYAFLSQQAQHGDPHHLQVVVDVTNTEPPCSSKVRRVIFRIVDSQHRVAGRYIPIKEQFHINGSLQQPVDLVGNSCDPSNPFRPTVCPGISFADGTFVDMLSVGCPADSPTCGALVDPNMWQWCPRNRPIVNLARMPYEIRRDMIKIGGYEQLEVNTVIYLNL
jgi:hypothetical protein